MKSIRRQLLFSLSLALIAASLALAIITYEVAKEEIDEMFDANLVQTARSLQNHSPVLLSTAHTGNPDTYPIAAEDDFIIQQWDSRAALIYSSRPAIALPRQNAQGLHTVYFNHQHWRIYTQSTEGGAIQVSQPLKERITTIREIVTWIIIPQIIFVPLFGFLLWLAVGRGLKPLITLSHSLENRGPHTLMPLEPDGIPAEITPVITALNHLLSRLHQTMELQRQFTADAAHELRSPLTAINLQLEILENATDAAERHHATTTLKYGMQRSIHLVQQLLTLARMEPHVLEKQFESVNLHELTKSSIAQFLPLATQKKIDLGADHMQAISLHGDAEGLRVLLNNLIDNAIHHTPLGGMVNVSVRQLSNAVALEVSDSGPGIPAHEWNRVMDRFYRGPSHESHGTGLGLSIVKAIADNHKAKVSLANSSLGGLAVTVTFPMATP